MSGKKVAQLSQAISILGFKASSLAEKAPLSFLSLNFKSGEEKLEFMLEYFVILRLALGERVNRLLKGGAKYFHIRN